MKPSFKDVVLGIVLVLFAWNQYQQARIQKLDSQILGTLLRHQIALDDSTNAILAREKSARDELLALKEGARELGGTLVAGVRIRTRTDTVYVPLAEVVTETRDSTRYATLEDSTSLGGRIRIEAEAPPLGALRLGYQLTTPEFDPEVGFVRVGERYTAVVSWRGQRFEVENAFFDPRAKEVVKLPAWGLSNATTWGSREKSSRLLLERRVTNRMGVGVGPEVTLREGEGAHFGWAVEVRSGLWRSRN